MDVLSFIDTTPFLPLINDVGMMKWTRSWVREIRYSRDCFHDTFSRASTKRQEQFRAFIESGWLTLSLVVLRLVSSPRKMKPPNASVTWLLIVRRWPKLGSLYWLCVPSLAGIKPIQGGVTDSGIDG